MQQTIAITNINLFIVVKLPIIKIIACYPYMGIACYPCMGKFKQSIYGLTVCLPYSCCFNVIQLSITIVTCRLRAIFVVLLILITSNLELKVPKKYLCSCAYAVMSEIMRKQSVNSSLHILSDSIDNQMIITTTPDLKHYPSYSIFNSANG